MNSSQAGFALTEVLVAAAIAASVLAAAATSLGASARLERAAVEQARTLAEAELITARLQGGLSDDEVLDGLHNWRLERTPYKDDQGDTKPSYFEMVSVVHSGADDIRFVVLTPAERSQL